MVCKSRGTGRSQDHRLRHVRASRAAAVFGPVTYITPSTTSGETSVRACENCFTHFTRRFPTFAAVICVKAEKRRPCRFPEYVIQLRASFSAFPVRPNG